MTEPAFLKTAMQYLDRGLAVVPIGNGSKAPIVRGWQEKRLSADEITRQFSNGHNITGIGIITGQLSGNLTVLDFDGQDWQAGFEHFQDCWDELYSAPIAETGSGKRHIYVKMPDLPPNFTNQKFKRGEAIIELRGNRSNNLAPPSLHPSGGRYRWLTTEADLPAVDFEEVFNWLADWGGIPHYQPPPPRQAGLTETGPESATRQFAPLPQATLEFLAAESWPEGTRNSELYKAALQFYAAGYPLTEAIAQLKPVGLRIGLDEKEIEPTIKSGYKGAKEGGFEPITRGGDITELPPIQVNARPLRDVSTDALNALLARNNPPAVFVRAATLTRVKIDEQGQPTTELMSVAAVKGELERAANFFRRRVKDDEIIDTACPLPQDFVRDIMALPEWPGIPPLTGITTAPTFTPDGALNTTPGYQPITGLYYYRNGLELGGTTPTPQAVAQAQSLLFDNLLVDFPFVDDASKAHAVAILLLPFVRPMIAGPTPLHLIDAPTPGTGKGLLADALTTPFNPTGPAIMPPPRDDEEWRKKITAFLIAGHSHLLIDNIPPDGKVDSAALAVALTSSRWTDRILGASENITLPVRTTWLATGNNVLLSDELTSRAVWIRLDAKMERPRQRTGFKYERLKVWARQNRGALVTAALVLIRNWVEQGRPPGKYRMGSFEDWAQTLGGILDAAGIPGFLANTAEMHNRLDSDREVWVNFLEQWYETYGDRSVGTGELFSIASVYDPTPAGTPDPPKGSDLLADFLGDGNQRSRKTKLGRLIGSKVERVYDKYRIVSAGTLRRAKQYRLEIVGV